MRQSTSGHAGASPRSRGRSLLIALVATVIVATVGTAGCNDGDDTSGFTGPPMRIGISLSLTGDFTDGGSAAKRGYELWAGTVNDKGGLLGRKVELKIVDDGSDPDRAAANYENLITQDRVDLVLGPYSSKLTIPSSQVAAKHNYAFVEPAGGSPKVFDQGLRNLFFVQPAPVVQQGAVFANYVLSMPAAQRPKTAAYPALDDPFTQPIANLVRSMFEEAGIRTVHAETYSAETDVAQVMDRVVAAQPDVVVAGTQNEDAYATVRELVRRGWAPTWLYMANGANAPVEFPAEVGRDNVNGIFSSGDWFPGSNASGSAQFVGAYLAKYGGSANDIDNTSVEAYSAGHLLELVAEKTGKLDNATIIDSLHTGVWPTPVGDLSWDAVGAPQGSYILFQWIDGKLQSVYPPGRGQHEPIDPRPRWVGPR
jgi:branched-chain amino acid transport system substrate-binding protein